MYLRAPFKSGLCHQSAKFLAGQHSQSMSTCITWEDVWRQEEVCPPAPPPADWFHASHQRVEHGSTQILKQESPASTLCTFHKKYSILNWTHLMSRNSVLFHNKDDIAVLITDVEPAKVVAEVVDMVNLTHKRRCRKRLLARHCQGLLLLPCALFGR